MTIDEIKTKIASDEYSFLRDNEHLGDNIILLTLGGSYAYGTNTESSDIDLRGCALNKKEEILTNVNFEQFTNEETDTTIYSFNKLISLLTNCNPNTIEELGCRPEHYLYVSPIGQELLDDAHLFLSKKATHSFGGYANSQLYRLQNLAVRQVGQSEQEEHILKTIENAKYTFPEKYFEFPEDSIKLYTDATVQPEYDTEIFMDLNLRHYPLRDYKSMWSEMNEIVKSYARVGKRNRHAAEHNKIGKHMCHLIRLYMMCIDILEREEIITYREAEHDLLMDLRNGKYITENNQPTEEFYEIVHDYETKFDYAKAHTNLPDNPDYKEINEFVMSVNERVVRGEI